MFSSFLNFVISFFPKQKKNLRSETQKFKITLVRYELRDVMTSLFGKDVLSIIDSYYLEGLDEWTILMKSINKEYLKIFKVDSYDRLRDSKFNTLIFKFRSNSVSGISWWHIFNYKQKNPDTGIVLDKKKYL